MSRAPLRVAVLGAGTVGGAVVAELVGGSGSSGRVGGPASGLVLAGVASRDLDRARSRGVPAALLTDAPAHLVADEGVDAVVELIGGDEPARTLIAAALGAGRSVVTANKHVVAHHGPELEALARQAGAPFRFEAAVAGGVPVLGPLARELAADTIVSVRGIVNGTTNYVLTAMADEGRAYADVLAAAQAAGYAEADPSGDVEGDDAVNKLVVLARLAFGAWLEPGSVERRPPTVAGAGRPGITGVTADELRAAAVHGLAIKLVASAHPGPRGGIVATVVPTAVPAASALGRTAGVLNRVEVVGTPVGRVAFDGPGAGGGATASSVLGDLLAIVRGDGSTWAGLPPATGPATPAEPDGEPRRRFFASTLPEQLVRDQVEVEAAKAGGFVTAAAPLDELRAGLTAAGIVATLYPIDE